MPTKITQYKIFLATPSDVQEEREKIKRVIEELNLTFGKRNGLRLELVKWETHSIPGIAQNNPQELINPLVDSCDIFVGILWKKFGSPTDKAESGTEEEFHRAYERFKENSSSLRILFYFKNTAVSIDDINLEQIQKIKNFKKDVTENKKLLYGSYETIEELSGKLRVHIPESIDELKCYENEGVVTDMDIVKSENELGLLDYVDQMEESINLSLTALNQITDATNWVSERIKSKTNEIEALTLGGSMPGRKTIRSYLIRVSKNLNTYANRIDPEITLFYDNFEKAMTALSNNIKISKIDLIVEEEDFKQLECSLDDLIGNISLAITEMVGFENSINELPKLSKELNSARNNVSNKLKKLISNLRISYAMALEVKKAFIND